MSVAVVVVVVVASLNEMFYQRHLRLQLVNYENLELQRHVT
jgi:hypothetical protein